MAEQFADFITRERDRLHAEREAIFTQQHELETQLTALNNEMRAIDAYEAAKSGKATSTPQARKRSSPATSPRGSKRAGILAALADIPHGLTRRELLEKMGLKGNKSGEMSVSNALTALTKSDQVVRRDGRYIGQIG